MIQDFWVRNFLSIRDKQGLSFVAKGPESELVAEVDNGVFLYKLGILYGANASGKSNMLLALEQVFSLLITPKSDAIDEVIGYNPFELTKDVPTEMHVSFYADGIRYDYDVRYNKQFVLSEVLNYYPNRSKSLFYSRDFVAEGVQAVIKFGASLKLSAKTLATIRENTLNNHSVLSVCRKMAFKEDIAPLTELHTWLMSNYHNVDGDDKKKGMVETMKEVYSDIRKRRFYNAMLQKADLNILEFIPSVDDSPSLNSVRELFGRDENLTKALKEDLLRPTDETIAFVNHTAVGDFDVPLRLQSKGTIRYIKILDALYDMISGEHVYYLDELGENLHCDLLYYYLNVFLYNSDHSQLIITSQETALLAEDLINENRGLVWLVDKNRETGSSEYARGDSFGLHKNLSFYNSYKIGRLGAKPALGSFFIDLED